MRLFLFFNVVQIINNLIISDGVRKVIEIKLGIQPKNLTMRMTKQHRVMYSLIRLIKEKSMVGRSMSNQTGCEPSILDFIYIYIYYKPD